MSATSNSNRQRFSKLGDAHNVAKRYKLAGDAVTVIREKSKLLGSHGRAIQIAAEMLYKGDHPTRIPTRRSAPADSAMTFRLTQRTIAIIEHLAREQYKTRGLVLAACAEVLKQLRETPHV